MRAIDRYHGRPETRGALRLAPLVFVRPGELRSDRLGNGGVVFNERRFEKAAQIHRNVALRESQSHRMAEDLPALLFGAARGFMEVLGFDLLKNEQQFF